MAAEVYMLSDVYEGTVGTDDVAVWHVIYDKPDGTKHHHTIPKASVGWRMAEYELDTVDEAIDFVLHEQWAIDPVTEKRNRPDPAMAKGVKLVTTGRPDRPLTLMNAPSIADAREAQRARIAEAKTRRMIGKKAPGTGAKGVVPDVAEFMKATHGVTAEDVQEKRLRVRAIRQGMGLDQEKPSAAEALARKLDTGKVPVDDSAVRRERDRRKDMTDALYGVPMPKVEG